MALEKQWGQVPQGHQLHEPRQTVRTAHCKDKEVKSEEFGAKVNKLQVDVIGFIEHLSFDALNE